MWRMQLTSWRTLLIAWDQINVVLTGQSNPQFVICGISVPMMTSGWGKWALRPIELVERLQDSVPAIDELLETEA